MIPLWDLWDNRLITKRNMQYVVNEITHLNNEITRLKDINARLRKSHDRLLATAKEALSLLTSELIAPPVDLRSAIAEAEKLP